MDKDKDKSSAAPADHREDEAKRNQTTYVEKKSKGFSAFFWIFIAIMLIGAVMVFIFYV